MSLVNYKSVKEFEHEGVALGRGDEVLLPEEAGDELVDQGMVVRGRVLDPKDPDDLEVIKAAEEAHGDTYAPMDAPYEAMTEEERAAEIEKYEALSPEQQKAYDETYPNRRFSAREEDEADKVTAKEKKTARRSK